MAVGFDISKSTVKLDNKYKKKIFFGKRSKIWICRDFSVFYTRFFMIFVGFGL